MTEQSKVVVFKLADEEYGVDVSKVQTIERMMPITRVPKTLSFVKGVVNLRGVVIPVIDLRGRFGLPEQEYTDNTRIITITAYDLEVGLIVDEASDVMDIDHEHIEEPPEVVGGIQAKYLQGIMKRDGRLLVLLNLQEVLNKEEIIQLEQMEK